MSKIRTTLKEAEDRFIKNEQRKLGAKRRRRKPLAIIAMFAKEARFEASLKTWDDWIKRLERRLKKKLLSKPSKPFTIEFQKHYIGGISAFLRYVMQGTKLDPRNAHHVEGFFRDILGLVSFTASDSARKASNEMFQTMMDYLKERKAISDVQTNELKVKLRRFQREKDPKKVELFKNATIRRNNVVREQTSKRGYTYTQALEDENNAVGYYSKKEFDEMYVDLANYFRKWRSGNKAWVLEIERGNIATA